MYPSVVEFTEPFSSIFVVQLTEFAAFGELLRNPDDCCIYVLYNFNDPFRILL